MTDDSAALLDRRDDVAWLVINRPHKRNALSAEVIHLLRKHLAEIRSDAAVRVVVLTGAGDGDFSAGGDLSEMGAEDTFSAHQQRAEMNGIFRDLQDVGRPTIARVSGRALAGGFGLALGCDFIVATADASFGLPEVHVGLWPYIVTESLMRAVTPRVALQLMLTGRRVSAEEGLRLGFVARTVPLAELDDAVADLVSTLRQGSPQAISLGRTAFYRALDADPMTRLSLMEHALTVNMLSADAAEGLEAFRERRPPHWHVTRDDDQLGGAGSPR